MWQIRYYLGGISPTFGGDITDRWGGHHRPLGGISPTFGNVSNFCMKPIWGGYHRPLGGISPTFGGDITDQTTPGGRRIAAFFWP